MGKKIGIATVLFFIIGLYNIQESEATPLGVNRFPYYLNNTIFLRLTGCMNNWLQQELDLIFRDDGVVNGNEYCGTGIWNGSSTTTTNTHCAWKTLNLINALIMDFMDKWTNTAVECCCDPSKDSSNCVGPAAPAICPPQFPRLGKCTDLKPEATNYLVARGYEAWATGTTSAAGQITAYWSGLFDICLPVPLMGTSCLNISLNDVCNGPNCGPIRAYNGSTNPGWCAYPPFDTTTDLTQCFGLYQSATTDRFILRYNPVGGVSLGFSVGQSNIPCGFSGLYNSKNFTGNEGFIVIDLQLGATGNPVRIDIDAATPSMGSRVTFGTWQNPLYQRATNIAPGKTDCDPNSPLHQGNCYVRAYLQAAGIIKLRVGGTLYLEHRTNQIPHMQDIGIAIRQIDFLVPPWISLQLDWRWTEQSPNCTNPSICPRRDITVKTTKLIEFIDLVLRGLFDYAFIPSNLQQYFGPVVFDITKLTQQKISNIAPTWSRPVSADTLFIDISAGGDPVSGTDVLRSRSCFAQNGVGPTGNQNELYLIGAAEIDTYLYRTGFEDDPQHLAPSCGYQGSPTHPAFTPAPTPTAVSHFPHAGNPDSGAVNCQGTGTYVGISIHQNVFSHAISSVARSGAMCFAISKDDSGSMLSLFSGMFTAGQFKLLIPELYTFLEQEFGSGATDIPLVFVLKPKYGAIVPGFPSTPQASLVSDLTSWNPLPITGDVLLTLPNNDVEIWVDVDKVVERWGCGPGDTICPTSCSFTPSASCFGGTFGTGATPPIQWQIPRPPAGLPNDFINNFPDCVSFIDCDTTIGNPDRANERRFIGQFNVGVTLGLDLNFYGCGRGSGKVFSNLPGFSTTWYNPWNPAQAGNCTHISHLRRIDLTLGVLSRVGAVSIYNDSTAVRVYYPFSNNTFAGYLADFIAVLLSGTLALDAQLGYTLSPIIDSGDDLYSSIPANNNVLRIGSHTAGQTADRLAFSYIARDDVGCAGCTHPNLTYQQSFLTIAIDLQGIIHPNFFYGLISQLLAGSTTLFAPPFNGNSGVNKIFDIIDHVKSGKEYFVSFGFDDIKKLVRQVEDSGYVIPYDWVKERQIEDFPPETLVLSVSPRTERTVIKLACADDRTPSNNCWYSWRWAGSRKGLWYQWQQSDEIEIKGLPDGVYTIEVRALDEMGLPDITPTKVRFVIDDTPPSIFFPKVAEFRKGEAIDVQVWDFITPAHRVQASWKIEGVGSDDKNNDWTPWQNPFMVREGRGSFIVRLPDKEGDYTLYFVARDLRGNEEVRKFPFRIGKKSSSSIFSCIAN